MNNILYLISNNYIFPRITQGSNYLSSRSLRPTHILALHLLNFHTNVFISGPVKKTNKLVIQNSFEEEGERDNESYEAHSRKQSANLNEYLKHTYNIVLILLYNIYFARNIVKCFET